jgi:hypothetical protein
MKKLLLVMVVGFGAAMLVKSGQVTTSPDNQIRVVGFAVPLPNGVQQSPIMGIVASMLPASAPAAGVGSSAPRRPAMPVITSASGTFDANTSGHANAPTGGPASGADGFSAVSKALRGSQ